MTTRTLMVTEISDDIDDSQGNYASQVGTAIDAAIRYCERFTFYFNETRDITFSTVTDQEFYDETDNANIPTLVRVQGAWSEDSQGQRTTLIRVDPKEIESLSDNSAASGEPYLWAYFDQKIRLYPIPGTNTYTIRLQVGPYRDDSEDMWFQEAFDMVKARAKYVLAKNTLKNANLAVESLNDFNDQRAMLWAETSARNGTGCIRPTTF